MRTRTIARWRRAALRGVLSACLMASPAGAQEVTKRVRQAVKAASGEAESPQPAPAQTTDAQPAQPQASGVQPADAQPAPDDNPQPVAGSPDEYVIKKGDTLWDLSQKFLNNPWYWPKIWSLNPGIENPHWIYPGNKLRLVPGQAGEQAPAQVQAEQEQPPAEVAADEPPATTLGNDFTTPDTPSVDIVRPSEMNRSAGSVSVTGKLAFTPPPMVTVRASGLVSPEELRHAGSLDASFEERQLLSTYDTAYVRFRGEVPARVGENLVLFRRDGEVRHPITRRKMADKTKTVGVGKVISITGRMATIQLDQVFEEIERGDLVRPWTAPTLRVAPRANAQDVHGVIVSPVETGLSTYGEAHEVFIDKGRADGVQEGNTFAVVRRGDGLNVKLVTAALTAGAQGAAASRVDTPDENIGMLLVVETKDHLSTAVVIKSVRELQAGDEVRMRTTGAGGGGD